VLAENCPALQFVDIEGGMYEMGAFLTPDEQPIHHVTLNDFKMMRNEVTVGQYRECVDAGACDPPRCDAEDISRGVIVCNWSELRENHPVNYVTWANALQFATWVGARLPSESEWEYAARSQGVVQTFPWGNQRPTCDIVDFGECPEQGTSPVCSMPGGHTQQGICDMGGNLSEWVADSYHDNYRGAPSDGTPWCEGDSCVFQRSFRVLRGGGWSSVSAGLRASDRSAVGPLSGGSNAGIRLVR